MKLLVCIIIVVLCCPAAQAYFPPPTSPYTVTFDDISAGGDLSYYYYGEHGLDLIGWEVVDHSEFTWGTPHSGTNVCMGNNDYPGAPYMGFGVDGSSEYTVKLVGAYFSTEPGVVVQMVGVERTPGTEVSAIIGAPGKSWNNVYVEISSTSEILWVSFLSVSSSDAKNHFCMDDLTVIPYSYVPEPGSFAALALGLGGLLLRRRR